MLLIQYQCGNIRKEQKKVTNTAKTEIKESYLGNRFARTLIRKSNYEVSAPVPISKGGDDERSSCTSTGFRSGLLNDYLASIMQQIRALGSWANQCITPYQTGLMSTHQLRDGKPDWFERDLNQNP